MDQAGREQPQYRLQQGAALATLGKARLHAQSCCYPTTTQLASYPSGRSAARLHPAGLSCKQGHARTHPMMEAQAPAQLADPPQEQRSLCWPPLVGTVIQPRTPQELAAGAGVPAAMAAAAAGAAAPAEAPAAAGGLEEGQASLPRALRPAAVEAACEQG